MHGIHLTRRGFLQAAGTVGAAYTASGRTFAASGESPRRNMVFILVDDMRFDALSIMGHPIIETPHLDSLARGGALCRNAFVTTSLCSPSRASILSGQYAHIHGVLDNSTPLPPDTPIFPVELKKSGYATGFFGKWHMGGDSDMPRPGFDRWVSFRGQGVYENPTFNIDGSQKPQDGYVSDLITDYAEEFIRANADRPFFAYVSHKAVHAEFTPAPRHKGRYAGRKYPYPASMANTDENYRGKPDWVRDQRNSWHGVDGMYNKEVDFDQFTQLYCETMLAVDDSVGRIVAALKDQGLLESTLIVFTSDNGFQFGEHGLIDKRTMYEASIKVPLIIHCPDAIPPGERDDLLLNIDIAPTILDASGTPVPQSMQGQSFWKLLQGESVAWREAFLYEYFWEASFAQTPSVLGVRTKTHKLMRYHGIWDRCELYDLVNDPEEMNNLVGDITVETQSGPVERQVIQRAPENVKSLFVSLNQELLRLLKDTGAREFPSWRDH
ncbi:MAG: sulfatase [Candidatus Hydrogenedentota bacterium]